MSTKKVCIVGGGCAAIATAFELTQPQRNGEFEVTIYQQGWRLGGKGASGRALPSQRIEEHGLHLWMGFYENAFGMMRACYEELGRNPETCPIATWDQAFKPDNYVGVTEDLGDGWANWMALFPPASGNPGDPLKTADPFSIPAYLTRCVLLLRTLITSVQDRVPQAEVKGGSDLVGAVAALARSTARGVMAEPLKSAERLASYGQLAIGVVIAEALDILRRIFERRPQSWRPDDDLHAAQSLLTKLSVVIHSQIEQLTALDPELRRVWEIADVVLAIIRGILRDGLIFNPRGFDAIDDLDWREWLRLHGASELSVNSAFVRASYDLLFAYEDGDINRPRLAAGQALRGALRMFFTYRGALFWKMQAGMGDIVFAPFYELLKRRGVKFEFFHRLEDLNLDGSGKLVEQAVFNVQAKVKRGLNYEPLVNVKGVPSWPSEPDFSQLTGGDKLKKSGWDAESRWDGHSAGTRTLKIGKDFDFLVLAVGLGEVPNVAAELIAASPPWRRMVEEVKTVATQAFQIWLDKPIDELGWSRPSPNISGYVEPFDTWADMPQLIALEDWEVDPKAIAYFCSVLPDSEIPTSDNPVSSARDRVKENAIRFLDTDVAHFWPSAVRTEGFDWSLLSGPDKSSDGPERFSSQFWTANINPTDRYILSLPGSLKYRISPLDQHFDNVTVAGDWTRCGHQAGCVEAAVMSGRLAAHAMSLHPPLEEIVGYDHP